MTGGPKGHGVVTICRLQGRAVAILVTAMLADLLISRTGEKGEGAFDNRILHRT